METTLNNLPMCECPHCGHEWQEDEYWTIEAGDEIECPACERKIFVRSLDTTITIELGTEED